MFARRYLERNKKEALIQEKPDNGLGICVVIPCYREPEILKTLESLRKCDRPEQQVEILIVINHSEVEAENVRHYNRQTKIELDKWIENESTSNLKFFAIGPLELQKKWAGAGLARKSGMDEAVLRFGALNKPDGIIVSLDADSLVEANYLTAIESHFGHHPEEVGATIAFKHPIEGLEEKHAEGIRLYEKYQYYYKEALRFTGYPFAMFTVGSAFAVTAEAYVKRGGMNRRQAGEDFYFLQNLAQIGPIGEIGETTVYPSARVSDRVPFGTGPVMKKWMAGKDDIRQTYNFRAFQDLKLFFDSKEEFFSISESDFLNKISELPVTVKSFLEMDHFWKDLEDLNKNCSSEKTFKIRFFQKFNAFKILKFLNHAHEEYYSKADLEEQLEMLHEIK